MDTQKCPVCGSGGFINEYCENCESAKDLSKHNFENICIDIWAALTHIDPALYFFTFKNFFFHPGASIDMYLKNKGKDFLTPFRYFAISKFIYFLSIEYVLKPQQWYVGMVNDLNIFEMGLLIFGIAVIAWTIVGKHYNFTLAETFNVFLFIYGTVFFINPFFIFLESNFLHYFKQLPLLLTVLVTDIPTTFFIFYCIGDFFRIRRLSLRRYFFTGALGLAFYIIMVIFFLGHHNYQ